MLHEEVRKYRELSGDTNPNTPISRIGGYLDGYEKALEQEPKTDTWSIKDVADTLAKHGLIVEQEPSAQPEIIRCKDCKYWREHKYAKETKRYIPFCGFNAIYTKSDDFCSRAERRENDKR